MGNATSDQASPTTSQHGIGNPSQPSQSGVSPLSTPTTLSSSASSSLSSSLNDRHREISRMDSTVRARVGNGVQYNMKIVLRGQRGCGKTSLWRRFQGLSFSPSSSIISNGNAIYTPTPQIQTANINWKATSSSSSGVNTNHNANGNINNDEAVKVEVWDVVDEGFETSSSSSSTSLPGTGAGIVAGIGIGKGVDASNTPAGKIVQQGGSFYSFLFLFFSILFF